MKKILALLLAATFAFSLIGCSSEEEADSTNEAVTLRLLSKASDEIDANIVADQLRKAGFEVVIDLTPDISTRISKTVAGEYDLVYGGFISTTPDTIKTLFATDGATNRIGLEDSKVDELISLAATQTYDEYTQTYAELERYMTEENAYQMPLFAILKIQAYNNEVLNGDFVEVGKIATQYWNTYSYVNEDENDTRALNLAVANSGVITHLDPIQVTDVSVGNSTMNMNATLLTRNGNDELTTDNSLSLNYAIAEGNMEYYFILRDDMNFATGVSGKAEDTGVLVSAEDVVFSLNRAKDETTQPKNLQYTYFSQLDTVEIVTDMSELETVLDTTTGEPIYSSLNNGLSNEFETLAADKTAVNNEEGSYQVVKFTLKSAFPQFLDSLTFTAAGVLSEEQVNSVNGVIDFSSFDITEDVVYGDFNAIKSGDNHLWSSGAYVMTGVDDYKATFEANPAFQTNNEDAIIIKNINLNFFKNIDNILSSFRSGEIDYVSEVPTAQYDVIAAETQYTIVEQESAAVSFLLPNLREDSVTSDLDIRLAILYALDQNAFVAVKNNLVANSYSPYSPLIGNPNEIIQQDLEKSAEHLKAYYDKQQ